MRSTRAKTATRTSSQTRDRSVEEVNPSRGDYFGLSSEEIRILRTIREENRQRGGFVRIFPTSDTYEYFSMFFEQRTTTFNQMIHQRLYPARWASNSLLNNNPTAVRRTTIPRSKHLSVSFQSSEQQSTTMEKEKSNGSDLHEALQRYQIYQRRLLDLVSPASVDEKVSINKFKSTIEVKPKRATNVIPIAISKPVDEGRHSIYSKNDLIDLFNQGLTLRYVFERISTQPRSSFAVFILIVLLPFTPKISSLYRRFRGVTNAISALRRKRNDYLGEPPCQNLPSFKDLTKKDVTVFR